MIVDKLIYLFLLCNYSAHVPDNSPDISPNQTMKKSFKDEQRRYPQNENFTKINGGVTYSFRPFLYVSI